MNEEDFNDDAAEMPEADAADDERVTALEKELEETKSKALYAAAELQNARRRMDKELADTRSYAAAGFARDMLSVRDHLDRAISHVPDGAREGEMANFVQGIEATLRELDAVFQRNGIEKVAAKGLTLDPNRHQAMVEVPNDDVEPGTIVEEMQSGYVLKDRLLRPALVAVAKKP